MTAFSIATNASCLDAARLSITIPHWLRVFGRQMSELVVVLDTTPPSGRIAELHRVKGSLEQVRDVLNELQRLDDRIVVKVLPAPDKLNGILANWFRSGYPIRCQAGTPIAAFIAAFEFTSNPVVLRADCDILFHESGWLDKALYCLQQNGVDLVSPAMCGQSMVSEHVSTRALMLHRSRWHANILPVRAWRIDPLRRLHRWFLDRPPWLPLEEMLEKERKNKKVSLVTLPESLGYYLHICTHKDAQLPNMPSVVASVELGDIPEAQRRTGGNFVAEYWEDCPRHPAAVRAPQPAMD